MIRQTIIKYLKLNWKNNGAQDLDYECSCAYMWIRVKATLAPSAPLPSNKRSMAQLSGLPPCELGESPSSRLMVSVYQAHGWISTLSHFLCWVPLYKSEVITVSFHMCQA